MPSATYGTVLHQLHRLFDRGTAVGLSEWQLLHRYLADRDEAAFEAIVARHGPMVLGVCRRLLHDPHEIEDAFQATFLVLVRKARTLGQRDAIGHWLYGVAYRVALGARSQAARKQRREHSVAEVAAMDPAEPDLDDDLRQVLDAELSRLPANYRRAIVLCYLEGLSHEEAARQLGWPLGTVKGRLARARDLLRSRLGRRGVVLSSAALATWLPEEAQAAVPSSLLESTVQAAAGLAGVGTTAALSATAVALAEGVVHKMVMTKLKTSVAALIVAGVAVCATAAGVRAYQGSGDHQAAAQPDQPPVETGVATTPSQAGQEAAPPRLPDDLAQARYRAAERFVTAARADQDVGRITLDRYNAGSKRLLDAQLALSDRPADRIAAYQAHLNRMREIEKREKAELELGRATATDVAEAEYYRVDAEYLLAQARLGQAPPGSRGARPRGNEPGRLPPVADDEDPRSVPLLAKLDETIDVEFRDETPLQDFLDYIQEKSKGPDLPRGLPIYVDPVGLQEAEKTLQSPIILNLHGIAIKTALKYALEQLGLLYEVKHGVIRISSASSEDAPYTPLTHQVDRARNGELSLDELRELYQQEKAIILIDALQKLHGMDPDKLLFDDLKALQDQEKSAFPTPSNR